MSRVENLLREINATLDQVSSSKKDELRVMQAMLNDKDYTVDIYSNEGKVGEYCPSKDARSMIASVIAETTKISTSEANALAEYHEFSKSEASTFIRVGKEFIHTYLSSGRKLPLGTREKSDVALSLKVHKATEKPYPKRGNSDGDYEHPMTKVPEYESIRVHASYPKYLKADK